MNPKQPRAKQGGGVLEQTSMRAWIEVPRTHDTRAHEILESPAETRSGNGGPAPHTLRGRFVVVTGGSSGIGRALVSRLVAAGASVLVGSRRPPGDGARHSPLDLESLASVAAFAEGLVREGRPIDALILNAGVHIPWKSVTTGDDHELHWQVNYLSNVLLCHLLLDLCRRSALKRVVYVASEAHRLAALPGAPLLGFWYRYARSKEAALTFFLRLQELHPEVLVRVVSPGYIDSEIHRGKTAVTRWLERACARPRTPDAAAGEILTTCFEQASSRDVYWDRGAPATPGRRCLDAAYAESLWQASVAALRDRLPDARPHRRIANVAGTWQAFGPAIERPTGVAELSAVVRRAAEQGQAIRLVGSRHSYNDGFYSRTCMVSLEHLDRVVRFEPERGTITCEAGISIEALCTYLDSRGFALRFCGNHGKQTLAGALATGTHGYCRDGGVTSELVRAVTLLLPDGSLVRISDERDLRALRLSLGTLGVVVDVTLAIEKSVPCLYQVACLPRQEFTDRLDELARRNEYLRFVPNPFDLRSVLYVTINHTSEDTPTGMADYIDASAGNALWFLVPWLRLPPIRASLGRALAISRQKVSLHVPFSTMLFVRAGIAERHAALVRAAQFALDRPDWLNMELAIPRERFADFERLFAEERPRISRLSPAQPYYTCRVVGAARSVLLAPNYDRDVVFVDIHADKRHPSSRAFLRRLEGAAIRALSARPHWGKLFFADREALSALYPAENIADFLEAKRRFDPGGVFSNDYTRRVLGV